MGREIDWSAIIERKRAERAEIRAMVDAAREAGEAARAALWAAGHSIHYRNDDGLLVEETPEHELFTVVVGPDGHCLRGERLQ